MNFIKRFLIFLFLLAVILLYIPGTYKKKLPDYKLDDIPQTSLISEIEFAVTKTDEEIRKEKENKKNEIPPYYRFDKTAIENALSNLNNLVDKIDSFTKKRNQKVFADSLNEIKSNFKEADFKLINRDNLENIKKQVKSILEENYIIDSEKDIEGYQEIFVSRKGDFWEKIMANNLLFLNNLEIGVRSMQLNEEFKGLLPSITAYVTKHPTLKADSQKRNNVIEENLSKIGSIKYYVRKNEIILEANKVIKNNDFQKYTAYRNIRSGSESKFSLRSRAIKFCSYALLIMSLILLSSYVLKIVSLEEYKNNRFVLLLAVLLALTVFITGLVRHKYPVIGVYFIPVSLFTMVVSMLKNNRIAVVLGFVSSIIVGLITENNINWVIISFANSMAGIYSVKYLKNRLSVYKSIIIIFIVCSVISSAIVLIDDPVITEKIFSIKKYNLITDGLLIIGGHALLSCLLTIGFLPLLESLFGLTTEITLYEYLDLNRHLLKQMSIQAKGTFNHSLIVADLAESAAVQIGANPVLVRAGAYYHDIGKTKEPIYFIENQHENNPHDLLPPQKSARIIIGHIANGLDIADDYNIPKAIKDIIIQHHGTTLTNSFYQKALKMQTNVVNVEDFRYAGPRPQTKEAALVFLADQIETAIRNTEQQNMVKIEKIVTSIINTNIENMELNESGLTLLDIDIIEKAFIKCLSEIYAL